MGKCFMKILMSRLSVLVALPLACLSFVTACDEKGLPDTGQEGNGDPEVEYRFNVSVETLWFAKTGYEKKVVLDKMNVSSCEVTELPDGWTAGFDADTLLVTSPTDFTLSATGGQVSLVAEFEGTQETCSVSFEVVYEHPVTVESDYIAEVDVRLAAHALEDVPGYVIGAMASRDYSDEGAVEWLNSTGYASIVTESKSYGIEELVENYTDALSYTVFVVTAYPAEEVEKGLSAYTEDDLMVIRLGSDKVKWQTSGITYDSADLKVEFSELPEYYGGFAKLEDWNNYGRNYVLKYAQYQGQFNVYTSQVYEGSAVNFPGEASGEIILPDVTYVAWVLPVAADGVYSADDFIQYTFSTPAVVADSSVPVPSYEVKDITFGGFTADVTPAAGAYKTYAAIRKENAIPEDEYESVNQLIAMNTYSAGTEKLSVTSNSFRYDDNVYLLAVTVTEDGRYGKMVKTKVDLKKLEYSDAISMEVTDVEHGLGDVTLSVAFTGSPSTITYMTASHVFSTDEQIQEMMAMGQMGDVLDRSVDALKGKISVSGLTVGTQYTFYAVLKDAQGNPSRLYTYAFIPMINVNYIMSTDEGYEYGMPLLSGVKSLTRYTLTVEMPKECVKYWLFKGDPEYFTGDPYTDTDKMLTMQLESLGEEVYTESAEVTYTNVRAETRIYMAWQDDKGEYHAVYEFNPNIK